MPSIHPSRAAIGLLLFAVLFLAALGYVVDQEIGKEGQGAMATMVAVAQALGSVAVSLTALTVIIVEGAYRCCMRRTRRRGSRKAARKAGCKAARRAARRDRAEGRAEGHAEGHAEERQAWEDWIARRDAAHAAGLDFTEPSPAERDQRETVAS